MKEMVGGCCVCSDEHGWPDNPLVYCDGTGCTVAVHQACYGIVTVPIGPWYCRKCESPDRQAKVRCELCPSRSGALKRVDTGGWAHVVCALYIPEVRFGNVTSMEPIILQLIPPERYNKICYICQDLGKLNRASVGACMQCNKFGCKHQFHVTCAQGLGLLCEEAGNYLDNVKYCGYCQHHYSKLKKGGNVKTIPPYKPVSQDSHSSDSSPEKEGETVAGTPSTSSGSSVITTPAVSASTSSTSKSVSTKSTSGRKSSSQQPSPISSKSTSNTKTSTPVTSTVSSPASNATSSVSKTQNEAVASTSKTGSTSGQEKLPKKWNVSPPSTQQVATESLSNTLEFPSSSESSGTRSILPSKYKLSKGGFSKSGSVSKSTVVITNTNVSPPTNIGSVISTSASSHTASEQIIKEKIETDAYGLTPEIKQTKKKKAASQSAAQDLSLHPNDPNITSSASVSRERAAFGIGERAPDSTNDEKIKKMKTENTGPGKSGGANPSNFSMGGGLNIQMEQNLSAMHSSHVNPSTGHGLAQSGPGTSNISMQNPMYSIERPGPSHTITSGSQISRNEATISPRTILSASHNMQGIAKYAKSEHGEMGQSEIPSSLLVSVPLLQSAQGLNLSSQQNINTIDLVNNTQPPSPQPSSSGWGLKIAYEPQAPTQPNPNDLVYPVPKRPRIDSMDMNAKMGSKQQGAILIDSIDKMASIASGGVRNKKRSAMAMMQSLTQPNNSLAHINLSSPMPNLPNKRLQVTPPPSTSTLYHDSPPISPGGESRAKMAKPNPPSRMGRAPHMLGNELNPDSPAVARLSEHLNAELAAHSVFRAPSPLVPPPLINRATGGRSVPIGSAVGLNVGGAQSLDQLLERQWEQGSQFLMDQAQHFDIASLLSCLHQLRSENVNLEDHVGALTERRDHLLAVNARLAIPLNTVPNPGQTESAKPVRDTASSMIRQPPPSQPRHDLMTAGTHQSMVRDIQPKPS